MHSQAMSANAQLLSHFRLGALLPTRMENQMDKNMDMKDVVFITYV